MEPAGIFVTDPGPAICTPRGLVTDPSVLMTEPAGGRPPRNVGETVPIVVVGITLDADITVPFAVIIEPATGLAIEPAGATTTPVGLVTDPSAFTTELAGIFDSEGSIDPSVTVGGAALAETIVPAPDTTLPARPASDGLGPATVTPVTDTIEPSL